MVCVAMLMRIGDTNELRDLPVELATDRSPIAVDANVFLYLPVRTDEWWHFALFCTGPAPSSLAGPAEWLTTRREGAASVELGPSRRPNRQRHLSGLSSLTVLSSLVSQCASCW